MMAALQRRVGQIVDLLRIKISFDCIYVFLIVIVVALKKDKSINCPGSY